MAYQRYHHLMAAQQYHQLAQKKSISAMWRISINVNEMAKYQ